MDVCYKMEFACKAIMALLLLSVRSDCSSDLDQEQRDSVTVSQLFSEDNYLSSSLAHQSQAFSRILENLEQNQENSHGISQALVHVIQGFQEAVTQLTQELSRQHSSSLTMLTKELVNQHSSSLTKLTQEMSRQQSLFVAQMIQEMGRHRPSALTEMTQELVTQHSLALGLMALDIKESFRNILTQQSEGLNQTLVQMNQSLQNSMIERTGELSLTQQQEANRSSCECPANEGFMKASDGWFLVVDVEMSWNESRQYCQDIGHDLASPPTDFDAFKNFLQNTVQGAIVWIGGKRHEPFDWTYLNDLPINNSHWHSGEPDKNDECVAMDADSDPPLWGRGCTSSYQFVCRYT